MKTAETDGTIIEFLLGSHPYDGVWFGDQHPEKEGWFWWRKALRDYASHPSPMSAEQVEELADKYASEEFDKHSFSEFKGAENSLWENRKADFIAGYNAATTPSVKADGWVSVEDGLPEDGEDVLCISKSINCPVLANYNNSAFEVKKYPCPSDRVLIAYWEDVTHWQPLPNPPKQQ